MDQSKAKENQFPTIGFGQLRNAGTLERVERPCTFHSHSFKVNGIIKPFQRSKAVALD